MAVFQLKFEQLLSAGIDEVWDFISNPANLKKITPEYMGFNIQSGQIPDKMYEGQIIIYKVSPLLKIKTNWVTEITQVKEKEYFVDEQRVGPYSMWHHQHIIKQHGNQVLMKDIVSYQPPFAFLGSIANKLMIEKKLNEIFEYRKRVLEKLFQH